MIKNILIIGLGNIGYRHFQALNSSRYNIYLIDPKISKFKLSKFYKEIKGKKIYFIKSFSFLTHCTDQLDTNKNKFIVAGGVAANIKIRNMLENLCKEEKFEAIFPPINLCGDNAAMIAMVGLEKFKLKEFSQLDHPAKPRWSLDKDAAFLKGAGVRL